MNYRHRFQVRAPLAEVAEFHRRADSLPAISPPPLVPRLESAPEMLGKGDVMAFTVGAGPLSIRWVARIEDSSPNGFVDRQLSGPFASWVHRHSFTALEDDITEVADHIEAALIRDPVRGPIGLVMWMGLPLLFAYRERKTRRLLGQR